MGKLTGPSSIQPFEKGAYSSFTKPNDAVQTSEGDFQQQGENNTIASLIKQEHPPATPQDTASSSASDTSPEPNNNNNNNIQLSFTKSTRRRELQTNPNRRSGQRKDPEFSGSMLASINNACKLDIVLINGPE